MSGRFAPQPVPFTTQTTMFVNPPTPKRRCGSSIAKPVRGPTISFGIQQVPQQEFYAAADTGLPNLTVTPKPNSVSVDSKFTGGSVVLDSDVIKINCWEVGLIVLAIAIGIDAFAEEFRLIRPEKWTASSLDCPSKFYPSYTGLRLSMIHSS